MKFIVCGLIGAVIEFTILKILVGHYGITPFLVYIPSALIPATFVFVFNKHVTFKAHGRTAKQTKRFLIVYSTTFVVNYSLSSVFFSVAYTFFEGWVILSSIVLTVPRLAYLAKAAAIGVTAIFNYFFSHYFIFRKERVPVEMEAAIF